MYITFLIGNGFDINCGLKCRYIDVYKSYCNTESKYDVIKKFKESICSDYKTWADFESGMCDYLESFDTEEDFLLCLRDFKKYLNDYLINEEKSFENYFENNFCFEAMKNELNNSFETFFSGINNNIERKMRVYSDNKYIVLSFNYTSVLDKICNPKRVIGSYKEIIHIHGKLTDNGNISINLGMDNISQIKQSRLKFKFSNKSTRAFLKPVFNEQFDSEIVESATEAIKKSSVICVYGMSLGKSDLLWKNKLVEWLISGEANYLFVYNYDNSLIQSTTYDEKMDNEDDAKERFLKSLNIDESTYHKIESRVFLPCGRNIFNIKRAIEDSLIESENEKMKAKERIDYMKSRPIENGIAI